MEGLDSTFESSVFLWGVSGDRKGWTGTDRTRVRSRLFLLERHDRWGSKKTCRPPQLRRKLGDETILTPEEPAMRCGTISALCTAAWLWSSPAGAHDFFLLPEQFTVAAPGEAWVCATVSAAFPRLETVVATDRFRRVGAAGAGEPRLGIAGPQENCTRLTVTAPVPGLIVAGASTVPRDVDYGDDRVDLIMGEYRVSPEAAAAVRALQRPRTLRVVSRRFAKTAVCVVHCGDWSAAAKPLGMPLEFVAVAGTAGAFRLLHDGRPLANYPVDAAGADGERAHLSTDGEGIVRAQAGPPGPSMLFAAFMRAPDGGERFSLDLTSLVLFPPFW